jgi:hypothetical protein
VATVEWGILTKEVVFRVQEHPVDVRSNPEGGSVDANGFNSWWIDSDRKKEAG